MIRNKEDLHYYLEADAIAIGAGRRPHFISIYETDMIHKFQRLLRKTEFYYNCRRRTPIGFLITKVYQYRLFRMQIKRASISRSMCLGLASQFPISAQLL